MSATFGRLSGSTNSRASFLAALRTTAFPKPLVFFCRATHLFGKQAWGAGDSGFIATCDGSTRQFAENGRQAMLGSAVTLVW